jgi:hypothetical protein
MFSSPPQPVVLLADVPKALMDEELAVRLAGSSMDVLTRSGSPSVVSTEQAARLLGSPHVLAAVPGPRMMPQLILLLLAHLPRRACLPPPLPDARAAS